MLVNLIYLVLLVNQFQLLLPRKKRTSDNRNRKNGEWEKGGNVEPLLKWPQDYYPSPLQLYFLWFQDFLQTFLLLSFLTLLVLEN
jgi:hypothetical protein